MPGLPDVVMADLDNDPALRDLVIALKRLHADVGLPSMRRISAKASIGAGRDDSVSYETAAAMLRGAALPRWPKLQSVVRALAALSKVDTDVEAEVRRFQQLWMRASGRRPGDPLTTAPTPDPEGYWEGDALDLDIAAGGVASVRRHGSEIRLAVAGPAAGPGGASLTPHEAEEIAMGLIVAARRARKDPRS